MLPTLQVKNTLPLHLKINFTAGPQKDHSIFLGRSCSMNIQVHTNDVFEVSLSNNSKLVFLTDLQLSSSEIDVKTRTLNIEEKHLKSWKGGHPKDTTQLPLGFKDFVYSEYKSDGTFMLPVQEGRDVYAKPGSIFKISVKGSGNNPKLYSLGYLVANSELIDDQYLNAHMLLHAPMFGSISEGKYHTASSEGNDAYSHVNISNFTPGMLLDDNSDVNLHKGQLIFYDKARNADNTFPDGTNFVAIDNDLADIDAIFKLIADYSGIEKFKPATIQFGSGTSIDTYANRNFNGTKKTISDNWVTIDSSFSSFKFKSIETQKQAGLHLMCALAEGITDDAAKSNPTHFRTNITVEKVYNAGQKKGEYPKVRFEIGNQSDINSDFNSITVNGKDYKFDSKTNQTPYIPANAIGKLIATLNPSNKRTGTPHLYIQSSAMNENEYVVTVPSMSMIHRMGHMTDAMGNPVGENYKSFIKKKAKQNKVSLSDDQAGEIMNITKSLHKTVVHGFKHTAAGNQTLHVVEGAHFAKQFHSATINLSGKTPKFSTISAGSGVAALTFSDAMIADGIFGDIGHALAHATHVVVHAVTHAASAIENEVKKVANTVEKALVVTIDKVKHFVIKTATDIAHIASKIYKAIKVAIVDIIDFFKFLISAFEDVPKVFKAVHTNIDNAYNNYFGKSASKYIVANIDKDINTIIGPLGMHLSPSSYFVNHKSSDPSSDKGKEKLHWLLSLFFKEISGGITPKSNNIFSSFIKKWENKVEGNILVFLEKMKECITSSNCPKDPDGFMKYFAKNLKDDLEDLAKNGLNDGKQVIVDDLDDIINAIDSNPFEKSISGSLPSCLGSDLLKKLLSLTGLDGLLSDITPANALSLLYAVPGGIMYAFKKSYAHSDNVEFALLAETSDEIAYDDPILLDIMGMINDVTTAISASLTVEKAAGGSGGDKFPDFIKQLILAFNVINATSKAMVAHKASHSTSAQKKYSEAVNAILAARIYAGVILAIAVSKDSKFPLAKVQCVLDVLVGGVSFGYSIDQVANKADHKWASTAGILESVSQMLEIFGFDDEPDSRTAAIILMDTLKGVGLLFRGIDLIED